jgi:hypothetical protein
MYRIKNNININGFKFIFRKVIDFYENDDSKCFYSLKYCLDSPHCYKTKIQYFTTYINNNIIATEGDLIELKNTYNKARKIYLLFSKVAFNFKYKKSLNFSVERDIYLNDLQDFKENQLYTLYEPSLNCKYKFKVADLLRVIESSLSYSQDFFIKPMWPKNPYINTKISEYSLWCFYLHICLQKSPFMITTLFNLFIKYNFNIIDFEDNTISLLKDYAIKDAVNNSSTEKKALDIREMLYDFCNEYINEYPIANLDNNFPNNILVNTFSKYLKYYYISLIYKQTRKGNIATLKLQEELDNFIDNNPKFGRKIMKFTKKRYDKDEYGNIVKISDRLKFKYIFITEVNNDDNMVDNMNNYLHHINQTFRNL